MTIGVKDTQDIIRRVVVLSRSETSVAAKLEPQDVGMATGPRLRTRNLMRSGGQPDYLNEPEIQTDEWQKLDDDIYKFLQVRKSQFSQLGSPPSHQFLAEMESQLKYNDQDYELGAYLGLMRQAADLDQTRQTFVTASERSAFHAFARRLTEGRRRGESFDPGMVKRYQELLESNQSATFRGLADLIRLISRAARQPLIGAMRDAPTQSIAVLLNVIDVATRFNQNSPGQQEFQIGPMDVFLGARTVLFNRSVVNPTLSMVKELVLEEAGLYHEDLIELMKNVGVFGSEFTLHMPESLSEKGFALKGSTYSAVELVMAAGARLAKSPGPASKTLATLADAILHKVQQQDTHKDKQIQSILGHFNRLLIGERRSAARISQERQEVRFDYMTAIKRASQLARGMQTGQFKALVAGDTEAKLKVENQEQRLPESSSNSGSQVAAPAVLAGLSPNDYENLLVTWDALLGRIRKKLTTKSQAFKALASLLARVRSLDTCLAYGLTPAGGRCTSRLAKLMQSEEMRAKLNIPTEISEVLEDAISRDYPAFLSSLESLIATIYDFRPGMQLIQFRVRDRKPTLTIGSTGEGVGEEGGELDEVPLKLILGTLLLGNELIANSGQSPACQFRMDGKIRFPDSTSLLTLGHSDPFLTYCAFLWAGKEILNQTLRSDLEISLILMSRLTPDWQALMARKYRDLESLTSKPRILPKIAGSIVRKGWERGFERGFMAEVKDVFEDPNSGQNLDGRLLELLTGIQIDVDRACEQVEEEKLRLTRDRVMGILN